MSLFSDVSQCRTAGNVESLPPNLTTRLLRCNSIHVYYLNSNIALHFVHLYYFNILAEITIIMLINSHNVFLQRCELGAVYWLLNVDNSKVLMVIIHTQ